MSDMSKKMDEKPLPDEMIVFREGIIDGIWKRYHDNPFSSDSSSLYQDLTEYLAKDSFGKTLRYRFKKLKLPHSRTFDRALKREGSDAGARPDLRDVLCYYAFEMSWEKKMGALLGDKYNYKTEKTESDRLRNSNNRVAIPKEPTDDLSHLKEGQDTILDHLGNIMSHSRKEFDSMKEMVGNVISGIDKLYKTSINTHDGFIGGLTKIVEAFSQAKDQNDYPKMIASATAIDKSVMVKKAALDNLTKGAYYVLIGHLWNRRLFDEIVSIAPSILQVMPDDFGVHIYYGGSLLVTSKIDDAIIHIRKAREIFPEESHGLNLECWYYCAISDYKKALEILRTKYILRKTGELYYVAIDASKVPYAPEKFFEDATGTDFELGVSVLATAIAQGPIENTSDLLAQLQLYSQCDTAPMLDEIQRTFEKHNDDH